MEALARSPARRAFCVLQRFGAVAVACLAERLDPDGNRAAPTATVRQTRRNAAFDTSPFIGLALEGTGPGAARPKRPIHARPPATFSL